MHLHFRFIIRLIKCSGVSNKYAAQMIHDFQTDQIIGKLILCEMRDRCSLRENLQPTNCKATVMLAGKTEVPFQTLIGMIQEQMVEGWHPKLAPRTCMESMALRQKQQSLLKCKTKERLHGDPENSTTQRRTGLLYC